MGEGVPALHPLREQGEEGLGPISITEREDTAGIVLHRKQTNKKMRRYGPTWMTGDSPAPPTHRAPRNCKAVRCYNRTKAKLNEFIFILKKVKLSVLQRITQHTIYKK